VISVVKERSERMNFSSTMRHLRSMVEERQITIADPERVVKVDYFPPWLSNVAHYHWVTISRSRDGSVFVAIEASLLFDLSVIEGLYEELPIREWDAGALEKLGVTEGLHDMFRSCMPSKGEIVAEELIMNFREDISNRFRVTLTGRIPIENEEELIYILETLSRPRG
jgi:hypothetical protein